MKKDLGVKPYLFPMPVLMIATYNEDGTVDVMNMAWGGVCAENMVALNIDDDHKTSENIKARGAFTLSVADIPHIELQQDKAGFRVLGEIVNVLADEAVLDEKGRVAPEKLNAFLFDAFQSGYYAIGEKVGQAWRSGVKFMK